MIDVDRFKRVNDTHDIMWAMILIVRLAQARRLPIKGQRMIYIATAVRNFSSCFRTPIKKGPLNSLREFIKPFAKNRFRSLSN
jgi:hypothetical protein